MSYLLGGGGRVLERWREYCWMTDDSILSMFRPIVVIRCPKPIMFSSMTSKRELILASIRSKRPSKDACIAAIAVRPPAGLDPAHASSPHQRNLGVWKHRLRLDQSVVSMTAKRNLG
ncbi:hypothetical protein ACOSP7_013039 [Xanthoceras sorbifolium]